MQTHSLQLEQIADAARELRESNLRNIVLAMQLTPRSDLETHAILWKALAEEVKTGWAEAHEAVSA
jgi:hypothetical protein